MKLVFSLCLVYLKSVVSLPQISYGPNQFEIPEIQIVSQPSIQYVQPNILQQPASGYSKLRQRPVPPPPPPPPEPPAGIMQLLLPSAADQQVQRAAAYLAGPGYAQHIQSLQLQGLANQAQAAAQRRAQLTVSRQIQQQTQAQTPSPPLSNAPSGEEYDDNASYQFGFNVNDDLNTNYQNRKEQRNGDKIIGSYSVVDADGFLRTVRYTADPKEGFKAEVNRQPTNIAVRQPSRLHSIPQPQYNAEGASDGNQQSQGQQKTIYQFL